MLYAWQYDTLIGEITLAEEDGKITNLYFPKAEVPASVLMQETQTLKFAAIQLEEYFAGIRKIFELPLSPKGTAFQQEVWNALIQIPYGETTSYGKLANSIGRTGAARAVGLANNRNPIPIIIPCHRVIGADGKLVGYGGGLQIKEQLLMIEKQSSR